MSAHLIAVRTGDAPDVETFLADRIYEHNAKATGYFDAESFSAVHQSDAGEIEAGICGYTWGSSCHITYFWVAESKRGHGLGSALLNATEQYARTKKCVVVHLASHSFQAPAFYERRGYTRQALLHDNPVGFTDVLLSKRLTIGRG
jgi:GNAT superfamily N-acetyltransferase